MRANGWVAWIGVLIFGCVAAVSAAEPGGGTQSVICGWTPKYINDPASRNNGAIEGWFDITGHISTGGTFNVTWERIADAQGIAITSGQDTYAPNKQVLTLGGLVITGPSDVPPGPGCKDHGERAMGINYVDFGQPSSYNIEAKLIRHGSDPGTYRYTWTKTTYGGEAAAPPFIMTRTYNPFPSTYHCLIKIKDSVTGGNIPGATLYIQKPYTDGPYIMDTVGGAVADLSAQTYIVQVSAPGYKTLSNHPMRIADRPDREDLPRWNISLIPTSSSSQYINSGTMRLSIRDAVDGSKLPYSTHFSTININGNTHRTDENGEVYVEGLITGQAYTVAATAKSHIAQTQTVTATPTGWHIFNLARSGDSTGGGGDDEPDDGGGGGNVLDGDWWTDLFKDLFVPQEATMQAFTAQLDEIKGWGLFGFIGDAVAAWNTGTRAGEQELCWAFTFDLTAGMAPPWQGCLDLRPLLATGDPAYPDGSRGSLAGNFVRDFRLVQTGLVWVLFLWVLVKRFAPRFSV